MGDRYRLSRPRSPIRDPARLSLQHINYGSYPEQLHAVPTRREVSHTPRNSIANPTVTTTYKVVPDSFSRSSSHRSGLDGRRSTLESSSRPTVIHSGPKRITQGVKPPSPIQHTFRSSDEGEYYAIPASSSRHRGHHHKTSYNRTTDNLDSGRASRGSGLLGVETRRTPVYSGSRTRVPPDSLVRHPDTMADDYGENGYGYTNIRDVVQYDLAQSAPKYYNNRRESFDSRSNRPSSIQNASELLPRSSFDSRAGPPLTTRGFDKIPPRPMYDSQPPIRKLSVERGSNRSDPVYDERKPRRPVSMYQDTDRPGPRDNRRDEYNDPRDDEARRAPPRERQDKRYDDKLEQRVYAVRNEGRNERNDRNDYEKQGYDRRGEHDRKERRNDDTDDRKKEKTSSGKDALAAGLSIAGAAFGISGLADLAKVARGGDDRDRDSDEREEKRRRDEEHRSRRERDDDLSDGGRERYRRDVRERSQREPEVLDLGGRNPVEKKGSKDSQDFSDESRRHHRTENLVTPPSSRENTPPSDEGHTKRQRRLTNDVAPAFNPKDTMDLRALKEALNRQDERERVPVPVGGGPGSREAPATGAATAAFDPRDSNALRDLRSELRAQEDRPREREFALPPEAHEDLQETRIVPQVVSPPPEDSPNSSSSTLKQPDRPVKGILRPPREKFPEDPTPIREGVAPLKDSKKDGIPPDARWTKISRSMVNPEALELGKERFEERPDCVIVLRVLSKEEVQGYAEVTQKIRENRADEEDRRRKRRDRHERHAKERRHRRDSESREDRPRVSYEDQERSDRRRRDHRSSHSESDTTDEEYASGAYPRESRDEFRERKSGKGKGVDFNARGDGTSDTGAGTGAYGETGRRGEGRGDGRGERKVDMGNLKEDPERPGTYSGYVRNPPFPSS